jgi:hypothetical protein
MARWFFKPHDGYSDISQSVSPEAFESSAAKQLSTSLIRESIQNTLDACLDKTSPVRVRFTLIEPSSQNAHLRIWFKDLMSHVRDRGAGLPDAPAPDDCCRYLVIEDFNTCGLIGDYNAPYLPGTENNFVNFLYHDGLTGKVDKLGSRGVGKIVLLLASRARTMFCYTIRSTEPESHPLLVGKAILRFRRFDHSLFEPACYFLESWPSNGIRQPIRHAHTLTRFRSDFNITRGNDAGLSIVIPYLDPSITLSELRYALVEEFHFAILDGKLVVELSDGVTIERIDSSHIPDVGDDELSARVALTQFAIVTPVPLLKTLAPKAGDIQRLSPELVPSETRDRILEALNELNRIAVRLPMYVHPKDRDPIETFVDVYFESVENLHQRPMFIRELLQISGEGKVCAQLRAIVVIRQGPLADLLRAAEGSNHTQWSPRTDNFKRQYKGRLGEIEFVGTCVNRLIEIARGDANAPVGGISTFFFSAPVGHDGRKTKHRGHTVPGNNLQISKITFESDHVPRGYSFTQDKMGFSIHGTAEGDLPGCIRVRAAYDVIRGSPWSNYDSLDFDFRRPTGAIQIKVHAAVIECTDPGNMLIIRPRADNFTVVVSGFDQHLDLIVEHRVTHRSNKSKRARNASETT